MVFIQLPGRGDAHEAFNVGASDDAIRTMSYDSILKQYQVRRDYNITQSSRRAIKNIVARLSTDYLKYLA